MEWVEFPYTGAFPSLCMAMYSGMLYTVSFVIWTLFIDTAPTHLGLHEELVMIKASIANACKCSCRNVSLLPRAPCSSSPCFGQGIRSDPSPEVSPNLSGSVILGEAGGKLQ